MILVVLPEGGLLADLERPAEMWWGQIAERAGGARVERRR